MNDIRILFVDDEKDIIECIKEYFTEDFGYNISAFTDPDDALNALKTDYYEILVVDYKMPKINGIDLLVEAKKLNSYTFGILLTAFADKNILEKALNNDLVKKLYEKPLKLAEFKLCLNEAIQYCVHDNENRINISNLENKYINLKQYVDKNKNDIIGLHGGLKDVYEKINLIAKHEINTLLTGESGTGKDLIANLIHEFSPRSNNNFVIIDCTTIPKDLLESELFGYTKGSFTGADKDKIGKIEFAHRGTLFMDEIGDLNIELQSKLLRVLQNNKITRVGSTVQIPVDFLLICTTNKNLEQAIELGLFRSDLYFRINRFNIHLPPLRERGKDIIDLTHYFIQKHSKKMKLTDKEIDENVFNILLNYSWPGNVRELENAIIRALISSYDKKRIQREDFLFLLNSNNKFLSYDPIKVLGNEIIQNKNNIKKIEISILQYILNNYGGNVIEAQNATGISKNRFYRHCRIKQSNESV